METDRRDYETTSGMVGVPEAQSPERSLPPDEEPTAAGPAESDIFITSNRYYKKGIRHGRTRGRKLPNAGTDEANFARIRARGNPQPAYFQSSQPTGSFRDFSSPSHHKLLDEAPRQGHSTEFRAAHSYQRPDALMKHSRQTHCKRATAEESVLAEAKNGISDAHFFPELADVPWETLQAQLPESWKWDTAHCTVHTPENTYDCWTCTATDLCSAFDIPSLPLTIAGVPVIIPVKSHWPLTAGTHPPPDPRPLSLIDPRLSLPWEVIQDVLTTFEGCNGFYVLLNGQLQVIVSEDFDTAEASLGWPNTFGGLKVSYIPLSLEPTMKMGLTELSDGAPHLSDNTAGHQARTHITQAQSRASQAPLTLDLRINDFIEARPRSSAKKERFAGKIGLAVMKEHEPLLVMSTHIISSAILSRSKFSTMLSRKDPLQRLRSDWNEQVDIYAQNKKIGDIEGTFDNEAGIYPDGFSHDITLVKLQQSAAVRTLQSPIAGLGWLSQDSWAGLKKQTSALKILAERDDNRSIKTLKTNLHSEVVVVGEGILLNLERAPGASLRDLDRSTWQNLVSRSLLYRTHPELDPPAGYSGIALYADGVLQDGSTGPGIAGFQSFVQRSGYVQNFEMEGEALEKRLGAGRVAFFGAFPVPEALKEYKII